jgi:hypothetical protein
MSAEATIRQKFPEVFDYYCGFAAGDPVEPFLHGGASLGQVLFDLPDDESYARVAKRIGEGLQLVVDSPRGAPSCS